MFDHPNGFKFDHDDEFKWRIPRGIYKLLFGLLAFSSIITEIIAGWIQHGLNPSEFYGYWTIQSSILACVVLLVTGASLLHLKKPRFVDRWKAGFKRGPTATTMVRGAVTLYAIITWILFSLVLSNNPADGIVSIPWDNVVLYYIIPVVLLLDWFVLDPPRQVVTLGHSIWWLVYPALYVIFTVLRGAIDGWYPYLFLDSRHLNIASLVWVIIAGLAVGLALTIALGILKIPHRRRYDV